MQMEYGLIMAQGARGWGWGPESQITPIQSNLECCWRDSSVGEVFALQASSIPSTQVRGDGMC